MKLFRGQMDQSQIFILFSAWAKRVEIEIKTIEINFIGPPVFLNIGPSFAVGHQDVFNALIKPHLVRRTMRWLLTLRA